MVFNLTYNKEGKPYEVPDDATQARKGKVTEYQRFRQTGYSNDMVAEGKSTYGEKNDSVNRN